jgi:hypothetical protein
VRQYLQSKILEIFLSLISIYTCDPDWRAGTDRLPLGRRAPLVRSETESIRRRALDEAIGRLAKRAIWAVDGIVVLGENADSESVRLST